MKSKIKPKQSVNYIEVDSDLEDPHQVSEAVQDEGESTIDDG